MVILLSYHDISFSGFWDIVYDKIVLTNTNMKGLGKSNPTEVLPLYGRQPSRGNLRVEHTCDGNTANHSIYVRQKKRGCDPLMRLGGRNTGGKAWWREVYRDLSSFSCFLRVWKQFYIPGNKVNTPWILSLFTLHCGSSHGMTRSVAKMAIFRMFCEIIGSHTRVLWAWSIRPAMSLCGSLASHIFELSN